MQTRASAFGCTKTYPSFHSGTMQQVDSNATTLPRQPVRDQDVVLATDGTGDVLPPPLGLVGVSFFVPISKLSKATHAYFAGVTRLCRTWDPAAALPSGLGATQDTLLEFTPISGATALYPASFQSMSSTLRKGRHIHGLHYAVHPTQRMSRKDFDAKVQQLMHQDCDRVDMRADNDSYNDITGNKLDAATSDSDSDWLTQVVHDSKAWLPSTQPVRLINEALWHYWQAPTTHANSAMLAFMVMHHFGASDPHLSSILHDSTVSRLVYQAVSEYDAEDCAVPNPEAVRDSVLHALEQILPSSLHRAQSV
jgi:hypothetical protein